MAEIILSSFFYCHFEQAFIVISSEVEKSV